MVAELEDDALSASYLRGANLISRTTSATEYYTFNAHGDVVGLVSAAGTQTKTYDYDAFGNEKDRVGSDPNPFRYCGEYFDVESGAYYLRARYYDPSVGRFTQEDTAKYGYNWYAYCNNNPIRFVDPTGKEPITLTYGALELAAFVMLTGLSLYLVSPAGQQLINDISFKFQKELDELGAVLNTYVGKIEDAKSYTLSTSSTLRAIAEAKVSEAMETGTPNMSWEGHTVYVHYDTETGKVCYVGRTNNFQRRYNEHARTVLGIHTSKHPIGKDVNREMIPVFTGLTFSESKILEQLLIVGFSLEALENMRYEISNKNWGEFIDEAKRLIELLGSNAGVEGLL